MGIFTKVINIDNVNKVKYYSTFGVDELYPDGTKRIIKKLTFKGWKYFTQVATVECISNSDSHLYYNDWKNINEYSVK